MAFLNALGAVSRMGQWRLRLVLRAGFADGRIDPSHGGLIDFSTASLRLTVTPRAPLGARRTAGGEHDPHPVLTASSADGTLLISNPGIVEALFPSGWSACVPPGLYDVRVFMAVGPENACIFDNPVELR